MFKGKRLQLALEAFRQVLAVQPEQPVAWNGIGLVLADLKKFDDARHAFARAVDARPEFAEAHYNLSFCLSNLGDFEGALRETKRALELDPYYVAQKFELAIDLEYEDPDLSIVPDLGGEHRTTDSVEEFSFDPRLLDSLFTELTPAPVAPAPAAEGSLYAVAVDYLTKGLYDRAAGAVSRAMARGGEPAEGMTILGDVFARQGLHGEALERYREARNANGTWIPALTGEVRVLLKLGRPGEALPVAEWLFAAAPMDVETLLLTAQARAQTGDPTAALDALDRARKLSPARADVHEQMGDIARSVGDRAGAITAYRHALDLDPDFAVVRFQLALLLAERNDFAEAEQQLLAALDAVPTYTEATLELCNLRRKAGRPAEALTTIIDLLQGDPFNLTGLIALGETLYAAGRKADAATAFSRVLRFDPQHPCALYYEGALLAEQHRYREAITRWQQVVAIEPDGEWAQRARRDARTATDLENIFARPVGV
jgi:tetratricopeptide (TPR) repeat protein